MKVVVKLNGMDKNPYEALSLRCNPFPIIPKAEYASANRLLADLEAKPIKDKKELRERLTGCSEEFVALCLRQFKRGLVATFTVEFPER